MEHYKTWEQYQQKYLNLKRKFLEISSIAIKSEQLAALKELYSSAINSQRASDEIENLSGLVRVLENRAELSYNKIEPFKLISTNFVNNPVLSEILQTYEFELKEQTLLPLFNVYKYQNGEYISENNIIHHSKKSSNQDIANSLEPTIIFPVESEKLLMPRERKKISSDFHPSTTSNHFCSISENNKYKSIVLYLSAAFVVVLCLLVPLIIVTIYVKSLESESSSTRPPHQQTSEISTHIVQFRTGSSSSPLPVISTATASTPEYSVQIRVFQRLSDNLGRYWRDLARHLDVKESEIDSIDLKPHLTLKDKALQILEIFRSKSMPSNWKIQLMRALHHIRRRDLVELIENLFSNN